MSGTGRKSAYRKSVTEEVLNSFPEPDTEAGERIARVVQSRGGNILQVLLDDGEEESLALLPTKFRKLIWVKRGDHLIVSGASHDFLTAAGDKGKVRFMVEHILYRDQVKHLKAQGLWPAAFADEEGSNLDQQQQQPVEEEQQSGDADGTGAGPAGGSTAAPAAAATVAQEAAETGEEGSSGSGSEYESEEEDYSDLPVNTNRLAKMHLYQDSDEDEDDDEDEEEDED